MASRLTQLAGHSHYHRAKALVRHYTEGVIGHSHYHRAKPLVRHSTEGVIGSNQYRLKGAGRERDYVSQRTNRVEGICMSTVETKR